MAKNLNRKVTVYINGSEIKSTIASLEAELKKLKNQQKQLTIGTDEYVEVGKKIREIENILHSQRAAMHSLNNEWKSTTERVAEAANVLMGFQSAMQMIDLGVGKIKDLAKDAAALDDVYADVMKTTGLTHDEVLKLNEAFKKMDTRTSREELNKLAYEAGKLGINSADAVAGFVSAADKINIALGDVLGEGAMVTIGKLSEVYAKSTHQLAENSGDIEKQMLAIGSAINMLGQSSTANENYLVDFLGRLGGVATQAGLSADQILGFASALDQDMQKVEMSATAFQKLIGQMIKKPQEFLAAAKMPLSEFKELMEKDMNGAILQVLKGFNEMGGYTALVPVFKDMGLDGQRAAAAISAMASSLDKVTTAQAIANEELTTGNSVIKEFNTKNENMQANAEKAKKRFEEIRIELGNELYPILIHLQTSGTVLMKGVAGFLQLIKENKAILPGLVALMANWLRVKLLNMAADGKLASSLKSLLGIERLKAHQTDVLTAKTLKKTAAEEQERLMTIKNQLAIERENLARQKSKVGMEAQSLVVVAETRVKQLETAATNQATVAANAHTSAINAQKSAFASTPWGLIITALTTIATVTINIVKNSEKWKLKETLRETARQAGEAEGKVKVLFERLQDATVGSENYKKALGELKAEYPELIARHIDEEGKIKDLTAAYNDLAAAARKSVEDRIYAEKVSEIYANLHEELDKSMNDASVFIDRVMKKQSEAQRKATKQLINEVLRDMSEGALKRTEAWEKINSILNRATGMSSDTRWAVPGRLLELEGAIIKTNRSIDALKDKLKPTNTDPYKIQGKSVEQLESDLAAANAQMEKLKKMQDAATSSPIGATDYSRQIMDQQKKVEALTAAIEARKKAEQTDTTTTTTTVTEETEKERKAREKAEAAWTRFSNSYDQAMAKINARTLSGIEAIGAEVDAATMSMRNALLEIDQTAHPDAAQMLSDLETASENWKRAKIDEYIAKTNKEIDKLSRSTAKQGSGEIDKVRKATVALQQNLVGIDTTIEQLTTDRDKLMKTDIVHAAQIDAQIKKYKELRQAMVGAAFAEIATNVKNPFQKQEDEMSSLWLPKNREKALAKVNKEIDKYSKALDDAIAAEREMARVDDENGDDAGAKKHTEAAEALEAQRQGLVNVREEAEKLAKHKALSATLSKWDDMMEEFGNKALSVFSNINTILANVAQQRLNDLEDEKDDQIKVLDDQLEHGLISQESYEERKKELEDKYKDEALKAEKEDWQRQKNYGYSEAIINAAVAATKLWAGEGTTAYKLAMSALLATEMATQIAAIANQPEPRAKGGYMDDETIYRVGEAGREWVASNRLLTDPTTAPLIEQLEAYQRGNSRALSNTPMAMLDMPAASAAAQRIGRAHSFPMQVPSTPGTTAPAAETSDDNHELVKIMRDLCGYMKDPRNRQAVLSRQKLEDFEDNEQFLRNRALL